MARSILLPDHENDVTLPGVTYPKKEWPYIKKWLEAEAKVGETYADTQRRLNFERAADYWARDCHDTWSKADRDKLKTDTNQANTDLTALKAGA